MKLDVNFFSKWPSPEPLIDQLDVTFFGHFSVDFEANTMLFKSAMNGCFISIYRCTSHHIFILIKTLRVTISQRGRHHNKQSSKKLFECISKTIASEFTVKHQKK